MIKIWNDFTGAEWLAKVTALNNAILGIQSDVETDRSETLIALQNAVGTSATINNVASLKTFTFTPEYPEANNFPINLLGYTTPGDGGGGLFYVDTEDTTTAEITGIVFVTNGGLRIKRDLSLTGGKFDIRWAGAKEGTSAGIINANTTAIQALLDFCDTEDVGAFLPRVAANINPSRGVLYVPKGVFRAKNLTTKQTPFVGDGENISILKHVADETTDDFITVGKFDPASWLSGWTALGVSFQGDGDLARTSGTENRTRRVLNIRGGIYNTHIVHCTVSQGKTGIYHDIAFTSSMDKVNVFNCENAVTVTDIAIGQYQNCRFDAVYNPDHNSKIDHGFVIGRNTSNAANVSFTNVAFQGAGKSGFYSEFVSSINFQGCLFERNNGSDDNHPYLYINNGTQGRSLVLNDTQFTPVVIAGKPISTSIALKVKNITSVTLMGGGCNDSTDKFAHSIVTEGSVSIINKFGWTDSTDNGENLASGTFSNVFKENPVIEGRVDVKKRGSSSARVRLLNGAQAPQTFFISYEDNGTVILSMGGTIVHSIDSSGGWNFRNNRAYGVGNFQQISDAQLGFFGKAQQTRASALAAIDTGTVNSGDATTDGVINNMRTRINELEDMCKRYGLLPE